MDIYNRKSRWKIYLMMAALVIMAISVLYTNYIARQLAAGERNKVQLYAQALERLNIATDEDDLTTEQKILSEFDIPAIMVDETGGLTAQNFPEDANLEKELARIKDNGLPPIENTGYARYIYFRHTRLLTLLTYFPVLQVLLILLFIGISYMLFSSARRSEQNQVWVGMAKETAHQLGTPISAIVAWIEHLKLTKAEDPEVQEVITELGKDVDRLELIGDRFSKIGSEPTLQAVNVYDKLEKNRDYMQRRASRRVEFDFPNPNQPLLLVNINPPLFDWVVENLLRNALDAMDGKGTISAEVSEDKDFVMIDISDTGKGIPGSNLKTVFQPGFTTKKRGWGLGLSLAKRIIESYHSGRIFVKKSVLNEGTTFSIWLPKA